MTAKEYLSQGRYLDARINEKLHQVEQLRLIATKATGNLSGMPRPESPNVHSLQDTVCKIVDLENEINRSIDALVDLRREIMHVIDEVPSDECRMLLSMRYLGMKSWTEIAEAMCYSEKYVYETHGKALKLVRLPQLPTKSG